MPSDPRVLSRTPEKESVIPSNAKYQILPQQIGKGTYSTIHLARDTNTGQNVAVKVIDLRRYDREFDIEVRTLALLQDRSGVVRLRHSQVIRDTGYIYMDYIPHPNLYNYVRRNRRLSQDVALKVFWNLLGAVVTIHSDGIAHRDLKPDNVMVDPATLEVTLVDFGLSMVVPSSGLTDNFCGSPMYMSPEILNREKHDPRIADVWSLGVLLYHMLVGDCPWSSCETLDELLDLVVFETSVELPSFLSEEVRDILAGILVHDPKSRLCLHDIIHKVEKLLS